ncbi:oxidoreductase [Halorientalis halophila]|uniref:oxidoreductase n=1 Tax=Halorientalis halophila TaxID=3108499 RepID=UPI00300A624A
MSEWTTVQMPDLTGKTVIVTGANSGLGFEATEAFAASGAEVVMACRSRDRGESAAEEIRSEQPAADLSVSKLDLADLEDVAAFAERFRESHDDLHVLCNNAGVMAIPRSETADGFETQFGVNHLGHFALTGHLLSVLRDTDGESRVITQSSGLHERGEMDFSDLQGEDDYDEWGAYAQSKLANLLFAFELDRRLDAAGIDSVTSVGCHPGYAATNLQYRGPEESGSRLRLLAMKVANAVFAQDAADGALPMLYAATAPEISGGEYIGPSGFMNMRGPPAEDTPSRRSRDPERAARLWEVSEELTGVSYDLPEATVASEE